MRILFLSQVLPYPVDAGPKMRSYFVLHHLVQQHEVTLLSFVRESDRAEDIAHLAEFCHAVYTVPIHRNPMRDIKFLAKSVLTWQPFIIVRDQSRAMRDRIRGLVSLESFDVIHADQLWMAQYALAAKTDLVRRAEERPAVISPPKLILDQHNAVHLIPRRMAANGANMFKRRFLSREAHLLAAFEAEICSRFDHVVWVTDEDRRAVASLPTRTCSGQKPTTVIPICADPTRVDPVPGVPSTPRITFLGGLHWPPNAQGVIWFADRVLPQVRMEVPEAVFTVIGKSPPAGLQREGVEVTGYITDPRPYLTETAVFVVPLHAGGGMRVKILDAWCWGLPVVSTTIGAEGIDVRHGRNILLADTAPAFAQAVTRVLKDPALAQQLGRTGRQTVLEEYNWQTIYPAWDKVYETVCETEEQDR